jgi:4-alpha-glucanotransferase
LLATLEALTGRELATETQIEQANRDLIAETPPVEPVFVAWDGHFPGAETARPVSSAYLVTEAGTEHPVTIDGTRLTIEQQLPYGYHELHVAGAARASRVISAPNRAYEGPQAELGVTAPVYSMRSRENDTGIGNFSHLEQLADLGLVAGANVIGTLPLVATFPDQPSPYSPASRRAWNELLIDLSGAPGWLGEPPVYGGDHRWVDYDDAGPPIRQALADYTATVADKPQIRSQVFGYAAANPEVTKYAAFRATCDRYGQNWRAWPEGAAGYPDRIDYYLTTQWLAAEQLRQLGERLSSRGQFLYLDLPIGCHPDGYDIWEQPDLYAPASVGAPPDSLFLGGQDWGLPATIPAQSRLDGHKAFIKAVRHQLSVAGLLRIDHVMGLHRTWWVPHGLSATDGAYVLQPTTEMFAIICLESHRAQAAVIGENLGTVPEAVRAALKEHRLMGMKVAQDGLREPSANELIAMSTHDTPPFAAWWKGADISDGEDLGVYTDGRGEAARTERHRTIADLQDRFGTNGLEATRDAIMDWMASSAAGVAVVNIDDLWAEERRQNVPGTDKERPNWRARHVIAMDDLIADSGTLARLEYLCSLRTTTHDGADITGPAV